MHSQYFIDQLRIIAALDNSAATMRVLDAFKSVKREDFAGPGPWMLRSALSGFMLPAFETPDDDPRWLYHSVLIVLDAEKGINIGDPSLWVRHLVHADIAPGARVLQVGTGVGYYSAILSHLVGAGGHVTAYEVEADLAKRARSNLRPFDNVEVAHGNAATDLQSTRPFDWVVAFAGVTHIPALWSEHLTSEAKLLLPLTGQEGWGAMILAHQTDEGLSATTLGPCGFYPCAGARRADLAGQIEAIFQTPQNRMDRQLHLTGQGNDLHWELA